MIGTFAEGERVVDKQGVHGDVLGEEGGRIQVKLLHDGSTWSYDPDELRAVEMVTAHLTLAFERHKPGPIRPQDPGAVTVALEERLTDLKVYVGPERRCYTAHVVTVNAVEIA